MVEAAIRTWDSREMGLSSPNNPQKRRHRDDCDRPIRGRGDRYRDPGRERQNNDNNQNLDHITCYNCYEKGHYSTTCTKPKRDNPQSSQPTARVQEITQDDEDQENYSESE